MGTSQKLMDASNTRKQIRSRRKADLHLDASSDPMQLFMKVKPFFMRRKRKRAKQMFDPALIYSSQYVDEQIKTCKIRKLTPRDSEPDKSTPTQVESSPSLKLEDYGREAYYDYLLPEANVKLENPTKVTSPSELDVASILLNMRNIHQYRSMPSLDSAQ